MAETERCALTQAMLVINYHLLIRPFDVCRKVYVLLVSVKSTDL